MVRFKCNFSQTIGAVGILRKERSIWSLQGQFHRRSRIEVSKGGKIDMTGTGRQGRTWKTEGNALGKGSNSKESNLPLLQPGLGLDHGSALAAPTCLN